MHVWRRLHELRLSLFGPRSSLVSASITLNCRCINTSDFSRSFALSSRFLACSGRSYRPDGLLVGTTCQPRHSPAPRLGRANVRLNSNRRKQHWLAFVARGALGIPRDPMGELSHQNMALVVLDHHAYCCWVALIPHNASAVDFKP